MIAYNNQWLQNLDIREAGKKCYDNGCISPEEYKDTMEACPVGFYSPNPFMRFGIFLLTLICASFMLGLLLTFFQEFSQKGLSVINILGGLICYAGNEFFIKAKQHYQSGVDDGLIWASAIMLSGGIIWAFSTGSIASSLVILIIAIWYTLRFSDKLAAAVVFSSFISLLFFTCTESGGILKTIMPFVIMAACALTYFIIKKISDKKESSLYEGCLLIVEVFSLSCFYIAGNYFVVRELSNVMFNLNLQEGESIPFGFVFKFFTAAIPVIYISAGIKRKDIVMIRVGLFALAATVLTVKFYTHFLSIEAVMSIAGIIMIGVAWYFTSRLKTKKHGYTYAELPGVESPFKSLAESLVIAETFKGTGEMPAHHTEFGGGSFGGGGAGEKF
jgi:hypothetical protein